MLISDLLVDFSWIEQYCNFLELREKGLNKKARESMVQFIQDFKLQSKEERRRFIDRLLSIVYTEKDNKLFLPQDLYLEVIKPGIRSWKEDEPWNSIPFRWSDNLPDLRMAVQLNPKDQIALFNFLSRSISFILMNQHEIDNGYEYDGSPQADMLLLEELQQLLPLIENVVDKEQFQSQITQLNDCARRYS
jgi:hypothetical protein